MAQVLNHLGQPVGHALEGWAPPRHPSGDPMTGRFCRLEALDPSIHAEPLHAANTLDADGRSWTYLPYGPFQSLADYRAWMEPTASGRDPLFFAIVRNADARPVGIASYLRIVPSSGTMEVGHVHFADQLKRTPVATEAMFLMMRRAFELGYRRYEWKCDALNAASRAAAQRLGFCHEGVFRQAAVYKGRNRDTAWYAVTDVQWPMLQRAFRQWLQPSNFHADGSQRTRLSDLTRCAATGLPAEPASG